MDSDEDNLPITEVLRLRALAQKKRSRTDDDVKSPKKDAKKEGKKVKLVLPIPLSLANYAPSDALLTDITLVRAKLERFGVAIVPGVLTGPECDAMVNGVWSFLEHISSTWPDQITRANPASWRGLSNLFPMHSMLLQHWGIGHSEFMWAIRQNPAVLNVFSTIWNTPPDQLLVSFDGASVRSLSF